MFIVYYALNNKNKKYYIGITERSLQERIYYHYYYSLKKYTGSSSHFSNALKIYDKEDWTWKIIDSCGTKEEAYLLERKYIQEYNSFNNGYNSTIGGEGTHGRRTSDETKRKISAKAMGRIVGEETREKLSERAKGRKLTDEDKMKKSAAARKRIYQNTKSGHTGIVPSNSKWSANYNITRKKVIRIGLFKTKEEAITQRDIFIKNYQNNQEYAMECLAKLNNKLKAERLKNISIKKNKSGNWRVFLKEKNKNPIWLGTFSNFEYASAFYDLFINDDESGVDKKIEKFDKVDILGRINKPKLDVNG